MSTFTGNTSGRLAVAVVCVAQFVVVLDATIVTTGLPAVGASLHFRPEHLHTVVTAYTVAFGVLLVPGGRLADRVGARRAFGWGLTTFVGASAACGAAPTAAALVGARVLQGAGAALLSPAALTLLTTITGFGEARRRAI